MGSPPSGSAPADPSGAVGSAPARPISAASARSDPGAAVVVSDSGIRDAAGRLDTRSKAIIEQLQQDGRRSYAAIARAVGLSEAATRQRVQRLLEEGVIQIAAVTMLGVRVEGDIRSVAEKLTAIPEASYVVICAGQFDVLVELICEDDEHLLSLVDDDIRSIPGVASTETFVYLRLQKENYQWGTR